MTTKTKSKKRSSFDVAKHVRRALVPHKKNHYRPHLIRLHGLTVVLVLALLMQFTYGFFSDGRLEVLGRVSNISVSELLTDTNAQRMSASLSQLKLNDTLNKAAYAKGQDMLANNYWAHTSPSGITPWKWLSDVGYSYDVAGENLAKNYPTADATVEAWMASTTHRANIMNDRFQDVGFAVVEGLLEGRDTTVVVAYYGTPASAAVQGAENTPVSYAAPVTNGVGNPLTYFGSALQSLSPATLGSLALLAIVGAVAVAAHHYRNKLPAAWRKSWKLHHGMFTLVGVVGLAIVIIFATGGGQI